MIAIIADIHGNYCALEQVLRRIDELHPQEIYCLGDVVGYYSQVNECCDALRTRAVKCIMGNHDWYMVAGSFCPRSNSVNDCLKYQRGVITRQNRDWLATFPSFRNVGELSMVHGGWCDPLDEYLWEPSREYFERLEGTRFVSGHVHIQAVHRFGNAIYCNPGSVGQPRDNDPRAAFATYESGEFTLHRVEYDVAAVGALMEKAGFSGYYYGCLSTGSRNLQWAAK